MGEIDFNVMPDLGTIAGVGALVFVIIRFYLYGTLANALGIDLTEPRDRDDEAENKVYARLGSYVNLSAGGLGILFAVLYMFTGEVTFAIVLESIVKGVFAGGVATLAHEAYSNASAARR